MHYMYDYCVNLCFGESLNVEFTGKIKKLDLGNLTGMQILSKSHLFRVIKYK